jgi:prepilin-type N-terminal cleavage/methylation domain-containing protein
MMNPGGSMSKRKSGFSLIELLIVVVVIGIMVSMAMPALGRARVRASLSSATARFSRTVGVARQAAILRGKRSHFRMTDGVVWVTVDTGSTPADSLVIVTAFPLDSTYGLAAITPAGVSSIEFDPRGVSTQPSRSVFRFVHPTGAKDSLCVSKLGNSIRTVCP